MPKISKKFDFSGRILPITAVIALMAPVVIFPERYMGSIADGLDLYVLGVLPALFPFFFFSKILSGLNFGYDLGAAIGKPLKKFFRAPPVSGYILVMSMLCGYPVGAKLTADFYIGGYINKEEAKRISAFCSTSGPLFIVGTVGTAMFGNKYFGYAILFSHYLSALINGLIFRGKNSESSSEAPRPPINYDALLQDGMLSSIISVAIVGGYVAIFNMILDLFTDAGIIRTAGKLLTLAGLNIRLGEGLASGLIEITKGCLILKNSGFGKFALPVCSAVISFGGISITLQSLTFLSKCGIKPGYYLFTKFVQALASAIICLPLVFLF